MWICILIYFILLSIVLLVRKKKVSFKISEILFVRIIVIICAANTICLGMESFSYFSGESRRAEKVERETYGGSSRTETYYVQIDGAEKEEIEVEVSPRRYQEEDLEELFQKAKEELDQIILGENNSFEYVDKDLNLPSNVENYPFKISWELSRYDVIDLSGKLIAEEIVKKDPEREGISVTIFGVLNYEGEEENYEAEITLFADEETENETVSIQTLIEEADEESREEKYLILPKEWSGKKLVWTKETAQNGRYVLLFGIVISVLLVFDEKEKIAKRKKQRKEEMLLDYPEIVSQFTMLMSAGMTAKNVWKKISEDYRDQRERTGRRREAYEEMLYTWQEMQSGISEVECYERFARRCEVLPYMKMGALLSQNLRKGAKGLADMLTLEAVEAMEEKKNRAKRLGEEAGTKLLGPMLMMLIIVLAIVVVPAFWAANL